MQTVTLKVEMMCEGCAGAVRRILTKVEGVDNIDITVADNKVVITGKQLNANELVEKVAKSGKATQLWE